MPFAQVRVAAKREPGNKRQRREKKLPAVAETVLTWKPITIIPPFVICGFLTLCPMSNYGPYRLVVFVFVTAFP